MLENITRHAEALRDIGVKDIMLGWTLGCHPSPNIEAISEIYSGGTLDTLAKKRHGETNAAAAAAFWRECSACVPRIPVPHRRGVSGALANGSGQPALASADRLQSLHGRHPV